MFQRALRRWERVQLWSGCQSVWPSGWFQGNSAVFAAFDGAPEAYIAANYYNGGALATISDWLLTPEVVLQDGSTLTFYTRTVQASGPLAMPSGVCPGNPFPDRLQVRMSTNGAMYVNLLAAWGWPDDLVGAEHTQRGREGTGFPGGLARSAREVPAEPAPLTGSDTPRWVLSRRPLINSPALCGRRSGGSDMARSINRLRLMGISGLSWFGGVSGLPERRCTLSTGSPDTLTG